MIYKFIVILLSVFVASSATSFDYDTSEVFVHAVTRGRVVGGVPVEEGATPYMAAITIGGLVQGYLCAGSLVSARHVLTAAHCINAVFYNGTFIGTLNIRVGTNSWDVGGQSYNISGNITHPAYDARNIRNDLGFLIVSTEVVLSSTVRAVTLSFQYIGAGVEATVAGWGRIKKAQPVSPELVEVEMTTVEGQQCDREVQAHAVELGLRVPTVNSSVVLCAYHGVGFGVCNGDSGSPLVELSTGQQIGIVSWGLPCARGAPDMFTRVSAYQHWIEQVLALNKTVSVNETKV